MNKQQISKLWKENELDLIWSYDPSFIKSICDQFEIKFNPNWIYTENKYRELSAENKPRIDSEDFLNEIIKKHGLDPDPILLEKSNKMLGEGSRRRLKQQAFLGVE